jgi:hypothetical protein
MGIQKLAFYAPIASRAAVASKSGKLKIREARKHIDAASE